LMRCLLDIHRALTSRDRAPPESWAWVHTGLLPPPPPMLTAAPPRSLVQRFVAWWQARFALPSLPKRPVERGDLGRFQALGRVIEMHGDAVTAFGHGLRAHPHADPTTPVRQHPAQAPTCPPPEWLSSLLAQIECKCKAFHLRLPLFGAPEKCKVFFQAWYARSLAAGTARSLLRASPAPLACQCRTSAPVLARLRRKPPETAKKPTRRAGPRETLSLLYRPFQKRERRYRRGWRFLGRLAFKSVARRVAPSTGPPDGLPPVDFAPGGVLFCWYAGRPRSLAVPYRSPNARTGDTAGWWPARLPVPHEHARTGDTTGSSVPKHLPRARAGPLARVVARAPTPVPAHDTRARKHVPISTGNRARNWRAPTRNSLHFRYRILFTLRRDGKRQENKKRAKVKVC